MDGCQRKFEAVCPPLVVRARILYVVGEFSTWCRDLRVLHAEEHASHWRRRSTRPPSLISPQRSLSALGSFSGVQATQSFSSPCPLFCVQTVSRLPTRVIPSDPWGTLSRGGSSQLVMLMYSMPWCATPTPSFYKSAPMQIASRQAKSLHALSHADRATFSNGIRDVSFDHGGYALHSDS